MRKVLNFVNDNKKIIIVVVLIIVLIGTIYFINKSGGAAQTSSTSDKTATEAKLTSILNRMDGVGEVDVMISEGENGIEGVVVVCAGANNIMTRNDILNAVSTALKIDKKIIAIYSMNI